MSKDFLFFNYSWVPNSTLYFNSFIDAGYDCDIVTEKELQIWRPTCEYKAVVVYLHEPDQLRIINHWLDNDLKDSFLIQHDTTDESQVQRWTNRVPDLIMQRELYDGTVIPQGLSIEPFHFPIPSPYDPSYEQVNDVMFYGCMTNPIRRPFTQKIVELSQGSLKHLKWDLKVTGINQRTPQEYKRAINQCKIGLHYFGNSRDSIRIWEIAAVKAAIIMPELRLKSTSEGYMPFNEYITIKDDFSDLEEKILYLLDGDKWKSVGQSSMDAYNNHHSPEHCCKYYQDTVMRYLNK